MSSTVAAVSAKVIMMAGAYSAQIVENVDNNKL